MLYQEIEDNIFRIPIRAHDVATHADVAYWSRENCDKDWHANKCFQSFVRLAEAFGYDLVKREVADEPASA